MWRSNNDYGVSTTRYAKVLDPVAGTINTVTSSNMNFVDVEKFFDEYKTEMKNKLEATTVEDLKVGDYGFSYSPYSGDSHRVAYGIEFGEKHVCIVIRALDGITYYAIRFENRKIYASHFEIISTRVYYYNFRG